MSPLRHRPHLLTTRQPLNHRQLGFTIAAIGIAGITIALLVHAAGPYTIVQPETGALNGQVSVISDATASGGQAVRLRSPTPAPLTQVKIWPIGDSITEGQLEEDKNGYRLHIWNALTAAGYSINYVGDYSYGLPPLPDMDTNGSSGSCILANPCYPADILYNITQASMPQYMPDIIIMNGGTNDFCCGNSQDPVRVEGYMQQWLQLIWSIKPNVYIVLLGMTGDYHPEYDAWLQQYATQQAAAGKHIAYVNIADVTTNDTVHPDLNGYQQVADRIMPKLLPMMQQLTGH